MAVLAAQSVPHPGARALLSAETLREVRRLEIKARRLMDADLMGQYRSAFRGSGLVFSDLREYQPGDDVKHIHWKMSARTGRIYVKSYEEDRQLNVVLAVDISSSTSFGKEKNAAGAGKHFRALELAALVALLTQNSRDALGLCLFSNQVHEYFPVSRSRSAFHRVIGSLLADRDLYPGTNIAQALHHISTHQRKPAVIFIVSDFISSPFEYELKQLCHRHDVVCALIEDVLDYELPACGIVSFSDAERGGAYLVDTSHRATRERIGALETKRRNDLSTLCSRAGADFVRINRAPLEPLVELMHRRAARLR